MKRVVATDIEMEETAFNRTILELKLEFTSDPNALIEAFNRTILELKHQKIFRLTPPGEAFNRTILELKHK